jgi:hypothetical protein
VSRTAAKPKSRRTAVLALLLGLPTLFTAAFVVGIEGARSMHPESPLFAPPTRETLADAIAADDALAAFAFIKAGQDPDALLAVRDRKWTGDRRVLVSPLVWAVANDSHNSVLTLLTAGAQLPHAQDRRAACFAEALGHAEMARSLRAYASIQQPQPCPPMPPGIAPLAAVVADSD